MIGRSNREETTLSRRLFAKVRPLYLSLQREVRKTIAVRTVSYSTVLRSLPKQHSLQFLHHHFLCSYLIIYHSTLSHWYFISVTSVDSAKYTKLKSSATWDRNWANILWLRFETGSLLLQLTNDYNLICQPRNFHLLRTYLLNIIAGEWIVMWRWGAV